MTMQEFLDFNNIFYYFEQGLMLGLAIGFVIWLSTYGIRVVVNLFKKITS